MSSSFRRVSVTQSEARTIREVINEVGGTGSRPTGLQLENIGEAMKDPLARIKQDFDELSEQPDVVAVVVEGMELLDVPTPRTPGDGVEVACLKTATWMLALHSLIGHTYAFDAEQHGRCLHSLVAQRGKEHTLTGNGGAPLGFHNDLAALGRYSPTHLSLACIRPGAHPVPTRVASVSEAVRSMDSWAVEELFQPNFLLRLPYAYEDAARGTTRAQIRESLIYSEGGVMHGRMALYGDRVLPLTEKGKVAVCQLRNRLDRVAQPVLLQPGQVALLWNRRCVHARGRIPVAHAGADRWLLRGGVIDERGFRALRPLMDPKRPVVHTRRFFQRAACLAA